MIKKDIEEDLSMRFFWFGIIVSLLVSCGDKTTAQQKSRFVLVDQSKPSYLYQIDVLQDTLTGKCYGIAAGPSKVASLGELTCQ